ncbi:Intramembrane protease RasP/YluC, implicated in cell division based on FtsL cleavage [hydrothermal vent metagenome]|uniref:Intramembrane protease RasP/YluC, implicated in cell division based on FtsL cleavage n=1 Tax=hydrothermal vent metagenome TaxID=652676 RepID=A0A3B0VUT7_9ZZZZ
MDSLISFIVVLGILIFVHELGHFLVAKMFGVKVLTFSLGFGRKVVGKKWGDTEYIISIFPLGGYVKMFGEQPDDEEIDPAERHRSFSHKPVWQRFGIVVAGPFFNLLFAVLIFFLMFSLAGLPAPVDTTRIGQVAPGSAAQRAGLKAGDLILGIDGHKTGSWRQVSKLIKESGGKEVQLLIKRRGARLKINAVPAMEQMKNLFGEEVGRRYMLGISRSNQVVYRKTSWGEAARASLIQTWNLIYLTILGIVKIIERVVPASELGGPIRIAQIAGAELAVGWLNFAYFMGLLSVNLGILNLLPIPVLDGGHLMFLTIEGVRRRPLSERTMEMSQKVGIFLLGSLMIFVFYNDILRIVRQWMGS